jgi:hypothetical protein
MDALLIEAIVAQPADCWILWYKEETPDCLK